MSHLALITVLPDPTSILTLQNAVHRFASNLENGQIELYRNGCEYRNETGSFTDCTIACQQPATVWDSMEILHNCASYSAVSQLLSSGYADDDTAQLAFGMGYVPDFNLSLVYTPIDECVHSFCHDVTTDKTCTHQSLESVNDTQNHVSAINRQLGLALLTGVELCCIRLYPRRLWGHQSKPEC